MPFLVVAVDTRVKKFREKITTMRCKSDMLRETFAEFLGTFILVLMGNAVMAVLTLKDSGNIGFIVGPIGWGLALMMSINITGGVSGGHVNPAITLGLASVGKLPWKKVMPYFFAQYAGAFVASIILYGVYYDLLANFDGGIREIPPNASATAQIFSTYVPAHVSIITAIGDQVIGTMLFMMAIVAVTDPNNMSIPKGSHSLLIGLSLASVIFAFPLNCGAPLNPARDLAPRVFTAIAGWGKNVFSFRDYTYFWVPILGPHIGGIVGGWIYRLLVEQHWPVDSYDFGAPTEVKSNGEFKKKDDLPYVDKKKTMSVEVRKSEE